MTEYPRNAFMEILSAVPDDELDVSFDLPADVDAITDHADHDLRYVERGTEYRRVEIGDDGSITIGKGTDWDCDISDIECLTCGRMLNLEDREWDFTV